MIQKQKYYSIYLITSPNGKSYIGKAKQPQRRLKGHIGLAVSGKGTTALHHAIRKYGSENMSFRILTRCRSEEVSYKKEVFYIRKLNTLSPNGYNLNTGGSGGFELSTEAREYLKATRWTEEHRRQASRALTGNGNPMFGKKVSVVVRRRIAESLKGHPTSEAHRHKIASALYGKPKSQLARKRMSAAKKGKPVPRKTLIAAIRANLGRPLSEEHRRKIANAQLGSKNHMYGKQLTDNHKQQISWLGKKHSVETRAKMAEARRAYWQRIRLGVVP